MREDQILAIVNEVAESHGSYDGFAEDITSAIIEDNGLDLSKHEVIELAEQYFEEG